MQPRPYRLHQPRTTNWDSRSESTFLTEVPSIQGAQSTLLNAFDERNRVKEFNESLLKSLCLKADKGTEETAEVTHG
jgi:hypothetical protein